MTSEVASKRDAKPHPLLHGKRGQFAIIESDKQGRDLRAHGRLEYVGERYLRFAGSGKPFLKFGADAPETLLGYEDFDGTIAMKPQKVPLQSWEPHLGDWETGDPLGGMAGGRGLSERSIISPVKVATLSLSSLTTLEVWRCLAICSQG